MKSSLDPAYIARQIMARNSASTGPPESQQAAGSPALTEELPSVQSQEQPRKRQRRSSSTDLGDINATGRGGGEVAHPLERSVADSPANIGTLQTSTYQHPLIAPPSLPTDQGSSKTSGAQAGLPNTPSLNQHTSTFPPPTIGSLQTQQYSHHPAQYMQETYPHPLNSNQGATTMQHRTMNGQHPAIMTSQQIRQGQAYNTSYPPASHQPYTMNQTTQHQPYLAPNAHALQTPPSNPRIPYSRAVAGLPGYTMTDTRGYEQHGQATDLRDDAMEEEEEEELNVDELGDDPLLAMQNNLTTFEDSVRSFAAGGKEKGLFSQFRDKPQQPRERKIIKRGPRKAAEPTGDVKLRLSAATNAFMSGELDEALRQVNDAIRLNAEIHRSWSLLSEILRERGEYKQSLTAAVCAAHLQPKIFDVWLDCGRFALELIDAEPDDAEDTLKIAIMVFSQAIKIQPDNLDTRQTRAALYLTRQSYKLAVGEYNFIIEREPYDLLALRGLADASVQLFESNRRYSDRQRWEARDAYQRAIDHYRAEFPMGAENEQLPMTWDDAFTFTALLVHLEQYGAALDATRSLSRWLLGRAEESFWDDIQDDREWDVTERRRLDVPQFEEKKYSAEKYGVNLPLRLRINLAICRLRLDRDTDDEAMQHLEFLDPADIGDEDDSQQSELFLEVASTLYETKRLAKALPFYEPLRRQEDLLDALSLYRAGKCYLEIEDRRQAEECFTAALDFDETPSDVRINARYELARMYEAARKNEEALYLLEEAMGIEREQKEVSGGSGAEPARREARPRIIRNLAPKPVLDKPPVEPRAPRERKAPAPKKPRQPGEKKPPRERMSRPRPLLFALDEDRKLEEERRSAYLAERWRVIHEQKDESEDGPGAAWMAAAKILVDDFRSFKAFYPWDRYLAQMGLKKDDTATSANPHLLKMVQRLRGEVDAQQSAVNSRKLAETTVSYRNVEFAAWLDLFLEYALSLARADRIKEAYDVCDAALAANVFFENPEDKFLANIAKAACAVRGRDEETCVEVARSFMASFQFCSDAFRMYAALGRLAHSSGTWFAHSKVQKFTLRQIKMMDAKLLPAEKKTRLLDQFDSKIYPSTEQDVQLLMLYGHILFISNSFTFALNYFVRAAALDPENLMVNISIGQAYLHYGLKRQTENRQQSITQGLLFLHRYYDMKLAQALTSGQRQEAHYNLARTYHEIGLAHLAAEFYKRVFREVESESDDGTGHEDLAREAAFNLQQFCLIGGDMEAVRDLGERWLVL